MMSLKLTAAAILFLTAVFEIGFIDAARSDYTYINSTQALYKFHKKGAPWTDVTDTCRSEGAMLFHPENERELDEVLSALGVTPAYGYIRTGLSDLITFKDYRTVDGRPVSEVYSKWRGGKPESISNFRCTYLNVGDSSHELELARCDRVWAYVCKAPYVDPVATVTEEVAISNSSDTQNSMLERLAEAAANQASALDRMTVNLAAVLERIAKSDEKQAEAIQQLTTAIGQQTANETAASDRVMTNMAAAMQQLTAAIGLQAAYQTAAMERQALALEKLAAQEENSQ